MVDSVTALLLSEDWEVREQSALLLGSFVYSKQARIEQPLIDEEGNEIQEVDQDGKPIQVIPLQNTCECLQEKLEDTELRVREAAAWAFYKLSVNRDGCDIIVMTQSAYAIISSFKKCVGHELISEQSGKYLVYLLEAM